MNSKPALKDKVATVTGGGHRIGQWFGVDGRFSVIWDPTNRFT